MRFPDTKSLIVPKAKVVKYLLSASHPVGQGKARWFERHGFTAGHWQILAERLRDHAVENEIEATEESPFGIRYIIEGTVLLVHNGCGYEVEFVTLDGETVAVVSLSSDNVRPVGKGEIAHAR